MHQIVILACNGVLGRDMNPGNIAGFHGNASVLHRLSVHGKGRAVRYLEIRQCNISVIGIQLHDKGVLSVSKPFLQIVYRCSLDIDRLQLRLTGFIQKVNFVILFRHSVRCGNMNSKILPALVIFLHHIFFYVFSKQSAVCVFYEKIVPTDILALVQSFHRHLAAGTVRDNSAKHSGCCRRFWQNNFR